MVLSLAGSLEIKRRKNTRLKSRACLLSNRRTYFCSLDESICRSLCWRRSKPSVFNLPVRVFVKIKKKAWMRKQNEEHSVFSLLVSHGLVLLLPFRFFISRQNLGNGNLVLLLIYWHQIKNALFQVQVCQFIGQSLTFSFVFFFLFPFTISLSKNKRN